MDESIPLQLASVNHMEVVAIHMIHLCRHTPGSRRGTGVEKRPGSSEYRHGCQYA